jgi:hypothetical protein
LIRDLGLKILYQPEKSENTEQHKFDVVAVHGLQEDSDKTWIYPSELPRPIQSVNMAQGIPPSSALKSAFLFGQQEDKRESTENPRLKHDKADSSTIAAGTIGKGKDEQGHGQVNWLKDPTMLPKAFPEARIMRFGYNYTPGSMLSSICKSAANNLILELQGLRDRFAYPSKPILFIGHSFGGIVIESALNTASRQAKEEKKGENKDATFRDSGGMYSVYEDLMMSTIGVIFLATPFYPNKDVLALWKTLRIIVPKETENAPTAVNGQAEPESTITESNNTFIELAKLEEFRVACFYESKPSRNLKKVCARYSTSFYNTDASTCSSRYQVKHSG